jgi:hypothetical protein
MLAFRLPCSIRNKSRAGPHNNWYYSRNINPYTGSLRGNPDTYLDNYEKCTADRY